MINLLNIRKSFTPNVPIRWDVSFSNSKMNIIGQYFTAKEVSYTALEVHTTEVPIVVGVSIPVNTIRVPITGMDITFYDDDKHQVYTALKSIIKDNLEVGRGGFNPTNTSLKVTINEYDNKLQVVETRKFIVQLEGEVYSKMLVQEAVPYESKLKLIVIGTSE